jgi:hypothetical protein
MPNYLKSMVICDCSSCRMGYKEPFLLFTFFKNTCIKRNITTRAQARKACGRQNLEYVVTQGKSLENRYSSHNPAAA